MENYDVIVAGAGMAGSLAASVAANSGLKTLNFQFRDIVQGYRTDLKIQLDKAAILAMPD